MIRNEITFTVSGKGGIRYENKTTLDRARSLTHRGAEIIIRRSHPSAIVTAVQAIRYYA